MKHYSYYEVDYLVINNKISVDDFKIDANKPFSSVDLYKNFQNQINIYTFLATFYFCFFTKSEIV